MTRAASPFEALHPRRPGARVTALGLAGDSSPRALRRNALALVAVLATGGFVVGLAAGGGTEVVASQGAAAAVLATIVALLTLPLPDRLVWPGVAVLAPTCFVVGVHQLDHAEIFVGMQLAGITWFAANLSTRLLALHIAACAAASAFITANQPGHGPWPVTAALWALVFVVVGASVSVLASAARSAQQHVEGVGEAIGAHFYRGYIAPDGAYVETWTGPGIERLLGRVPQAGEDAGAMWMDAVHPDDRPGYEGWLAALGARETDEHEYRLVGLDGVERWVLERARVTAIVDGLVHHEGLVWDISARRVAERRLEAARRRLTELIAAIDEVVLQYEVGAAGWRTTFVGPGLEQLLDSETSRASGDPLLAAASPLDRTLLLEHRSRVLREGRGEIEYRITGRGGRQRWVAERYSVSGEDAGLVVGAIVSDVTERHRIAAELSAARDEAERRARTDPLTGVSNRLHFSERLDAEIARFSRGGRPFGLVLLDLDHFKQINDRAGHLAGDRVLIEVAARLQARLRPYDAIARWGGEEFAVLVAEVEDEAALASVCESLRATVDRLRVPLAGREAHVTISVGAVLAREADATADRLLGVADEVLYRAKALGRNRVELGVEPRTRRGTVVPLGRRTRVL